MAGKHFQQQSTPPPVHRTDEVCEICGGIDNPKDILICPRCKISREHVYCRKILSRDNYDDWSCDDCEAKKIGFHEDVNQNINTLFSVKGKNQRVEKIVKKGKVKYIPSKEAIKLSLGSRKGEVSAKTFKQIKPSSLRIDTHMSTKASVHQSSKQAPSVVKRSKISHDPRGMETLQASRKEIQMDRPVETMVPTKIKDACLVKATSMQREALSEKPSVLTICSGAVKPAIGTKLASSVENISRPNEAKSISPQEKQFPPPISSAIPAVETIVANPRKEEDVLKEASSAPSGHQVSGDLYPKVSDIGNRELKNAEIKADKFDRVPASDSSWKGWFEILVDAFQNVYFDFEAHPCSRSSRKVLNCSKRMPQLLQFTPINQNEVWGNLFQDSCPNEDDIGLYFFSTKDKSRTSGFDLIMMFIEAQDCAMRCELNRVELYVFTSKALSADHQKLDDELFLWGIFHKIKKQKDLSELYNKFPSALPDPSNSYENTETNNNDDDDDNAIDMEIDMIGGIDLEEMKIISRDSSVEKEPLLDFPPGFEDIHRMKIPKN